MAAQVALRHALGQGHRLAQRRGDIAVQQEGQHAGQQCGNRAATEQHHAGTRFQGRRFLAALHQQHAFCLADLTEQGAHGVHVGLAFAGLLGRHHGLHIAVGQGGAAQRDDRFDGARQPALLGRFQGRQPGLLGRIVRGQRADLLQVLAENALAIQQRFQRGFLARQGKAPFTSFDIDQAFEQAARFAQHFIGMHIPAIGFTQAGKIGLGRTDQYHHQGDHGAERQVKTRAYFQVRQNHVTLHSWML